MNSQSHNYVHDLLCFIISSYPIRDMFTHNLYSCSKSYVCDKGNTPLRPYPQVMATAISQWWLPPSFAPTLTLEKKRKKSKTKTQMV